MGKSLLAAGVIVLAATLAGCIPTDQNTSMSDPSWKTNTGNCYSNGRVGYSRDYSYGSGYVTGQNRSC